jgi:hypothetical protein
VYFEESMEKEKQANKQPVKKQQSYLGLIILLTLVLTIPLAVLSLQQQQDIRERAAEPTQPIVQPSVSGSHIFSGYVYHDDNKDGVRQQGERPYPKIKVQLKEYIGVKTSDETYTQETLTDTTGYFTFKIPNKTAKFSYALKVILPNGYKTINTNPTLFPSANSDTQELVEFGLFPMSR